MNDKAKIDVLYEALEEIADMDIDLAEAEMFVTMIQDAARAALDKIDDE